MIKLLERAQFLVIRHGNALACANGCSGRVVSNFHEKAGPVKPFYSPAICIADCRPAGGIEPPSFLLGKGSCSVIDKADRLLAGGAQCCRPKIPNHRLALLPSALFFVELLLRCQLGVLN